MGKRIRLLLVILSVSLNAAFIVAWAVKTLPQPAPAPATTSCGQDSTCTVGCPLHRAIGTTDAQWQTLEPLQRDFRLATRASCQEINRLRTEMIAFLGASAVLRDSVEARQNQILALQRRMQDLTVQHLLAEKQVLTAAQWEKLLALLEHGEGCASHAALTGEGRRGERCATHSSNTPR